MAIRPTVSVLMPVRNGERYIAAAIDSVLEQSYSEFELVIVDDGSTDGTASIVEGYADPRIVVVRRAALGIAQALNEGLDVCRADFIARLDADDCMLRDRLASQVAHLTKHPDVGGVASNYWIINESGIRVGHVDSALSTVGGVKRHTEKGGRLIYPHATVMYRKSDVLSVGGYESKFEPSEDVHLFLKMYYAGRLLIYQVERLTEVRVHVDGHGVTAQNIDRQFDVNDFLFMNLQRHLRGEHQLSQEAYRAHIEESLARKVNHELKRYSYRCLRRSQEMQVRGKRWSALASLAAAATLNPERLASKMSRTVA